jgi:hypothetical protein
VRCLAHYRSTVFEGNEMKYFAATLPVELRNGHLALKESAARSVGESLSGEYSFAEPFPHIVIDNFLPTDVADRLLDAFPNHATGQAKAYEMGYAGLHKTQFYPGDCDGFGHSFFLFCNSAPMLQFLEGLTSIKSLLADPYFEGGGFHQIERGGKLGIHADFRVNERLHLQRQLNMLIYLNKDWLEDWGGELELWDREMNGKARGVLPTFNRCVVFSTDATSHHGHPDALKCPEGIARKSIALYYYTASPRIYEDVPTTSTQYHARPGDDRAVRDEVRRLQRNNLIRELTPPAIFRGLRLLRDRFRSGD